jgi:tetratricopeptide (TPR) repeat protein
MRDIASETGDASAAVVQLVTALVRTGDMEGAERVIDETLSRNPDAIGARLMRAELTLMRNDVDGTRAILNEIVDTDPDSPAGYASLATLHIGLDERPAAEDILRRGIATATQTDGLRLTLAGLLEQRGEIDGAIEQYQAVYESQPASPLAANNYAALLGQYRADDPEAIERAQRIAQRLRSSTVPEFQDTYGWLQYLSGNYEAALRSLRPASEARPENAWIRFHTGMTFAALDQVEEARLHLEAALAIDPAFPKAEEARATLADLPTAP